MPRWLALVFISPAAVLVAVFILYPLFFSVIRSLYDDNPRQQRFVGIENYRRVLDEPQTFMAVQNTVIWVIVAPTVVCAFGLVIAVLAERIRWAAALRLVLIMPMAISLFASGVIFRLVYDQDPERGLLNAVVVTAHDLVSSPSQYPDARPDPDARPGELAALGHRDGGLVTTVGYRLGEVVPLALVGTKDSQLPAQTLTATMPTATPGELRGVVWSDVLPVPAGRPGEIDASERGMPRITVEALDDRGVVAAIATTGDDGTFAFPDLTDGSYLLRLPAGNFTAPFRGHTWLGPGLITPVIMSCWIWVMAGFAMILVAAGLAAIPREVLDAARVDGATEMQVLRRVTIPLLWPVLVVVFVTLVIVVLKVFDLVFVIAPGSVQDEANVLAMQIWRVSFDFRPEYGLGSALCVVLFLLTVPAMLFCIRKFRGESQ